MSNLHDSFFRIKKDPRKSSSDSPQKIDNNILVKPNKRKFYFPKFSHYPKSKKYAEIIAFILSIAAYILYYLSLGGCDGTQTECLKNSNIAYYYLLVNYCFLSAGIITLLLFFMLIKLISKYHLIHIIIIYSILFLSDTGATLMHHGTYNIIGFIIFFIFFCVFLFTVSKVQDLLINKTLKRKLIVINIIILLIILSRYLVHNAFKKGCKDWDLGLNNTRIKDDINKYPCQINRPISCHINYFNNKQDLSKLLKLECSNNINSNQVINSRNLLIKYINRKELEKTKKFGFPLTNNDKFKINYYLTPDIFTQKVYDNIIDMDNPPNDLKPEEYPEITLNFKEIGDNYKKGDKSMKYMGKININITKNEKLSIERKNKEIPDSLFNNIIMIYTDAVSRAHFKRKMPKTCAFIEKFMKNNFENNYNNNRNNITDINKMNNKVENTLNGKNDNDTHIKFRNLVSKKHKKKRRYIKNRLKINNSIYKNYKNEMLNTTNNNINNKKNYINDKKTSKVKRKDLNNIKNSIFNKSKNLRKKNKTHNYTNNSVKINNYKNSIKNINTNITNIKNNNIIVIRNNTKNNPFIFTNDTNTIKYENNNNTNLINNKDDIYLVININNKTFLNNAYTNNSINITNNTHNIYSLNDKNDITNEKDFKFQNNANNLRKTNIVNDKLYAYQFFKYHTFTSGTRFNAMPMFFGKSVYETSGTNIIKYFKELGYITAQSTDMCSKEVWEPEKEPSSLDFDFWDHENVAMFCDPSYMDRKSLYSIYKGVYSLLRRCFYGKEVHDYIFEYGTKFWESYPDNKKFLRLGFNDGHESTFEVLQYLDEPMYNFLNSFYEKGYLNNTAIIIISDHGNHMPGIYNLFFSEQYETERVLGNFYIIINSNILFNEKKELFRKYNENVMENQQSIITPYDIYNTLIHILYGEKPNNKFTPRGNSIFMSIDNSKRDCNFFDQDNEEKGLCKCVPNSKYEKFVYYNKNN